ncbi:hypothetical protein L0128_22550, partial [candidate division KSB1 bacterium]|nr:hypothetical protein [candidate division KSB1 bacterium]
MQRSFWFIFSLLLILGFHQGAFAQGDEWKTFNVSNTNGGLTNDDVRAIAVAGDNVWFGTHGGGLCRYQKSTDTWQNYRPTNSGIISNYVQALKSDGADLWIGTDIGVNRFTPGNDQWATWDSIYCVNSIGVDWENVWFGTSADGVFRYHKPTVHWSALDSLNSQLPGNHVASIEVMGEYVWFGTKRGAARYR